MAVDDTARLTCPHCFESVEVYIDPQSEGELIWDCDVCCRPWSLQVSRRLDGELLVRANRAQ
ncbi:MAG: CPXCG motif-containing cysteine-rich protein [Myxococcales bacterium]|nr:CPXCG motif-containing cysteine-rich protein [Myxococcales bacterium]